MAKIRLKAVSKADYRSSSEERQRFGGDTVTSFYVTRLDTDETRVFTGYGPTSEERKTYALSKAAEFWNLSGGPRPAQAMDYYVWEVFEDDEQLKEKPAGPLTFRQAKDLARVSARQSDARFVVTEGKDPKYFTLRRCYEARTGAILFRK